jgi:hypothetical protein
MTPAASTCWQGRNMPRTSLAGLQHSRIHLTSCTPAHLKGGWLHCKLLLAVWQHFAAGSVLQDCCCLTARCARQPQSVHTLKQHCCSTLMVIPNKEVNSSSAASARILQCQVSECDAACLTQQHNRTPEDQVQSHRWFCTCLALDGHIPVETRHAALPQHLEVPRMLRRRHSENCRVLIMGQVGPFAAPLACQA